MAGKLFLCATPIGNLEDMSVRAVRTLKEADLIAAEDTRNSLRLLNHFDIHTPMTSYHEYNRVEKAHVLIDHLLAGENVALITDAGTPGISDPGEVLVALCQERGIEVTSIPGPCALINALIISGLPTRRFCFEAFLPPDKKEREGILTDLEKETRTILIYEAPHRLKKTLAQLEQHLGGARRVSLCRELTKIHEEVFASTLADASAYYESHEPRGEYVLVIEGADPGALRRQEQTAWEDMSVTDHVQLYLQQGMDKKDAMKAAARDRGLAKRDIYKALLEEEEGAL